MSQVSIDDRHSRTVPDEFQTAEGTITNGSDQWVSQTSLLVWKVSYQGNGHIHTWCQSAETLVLQEWM